MVLKMFGKGSHHPGSGKGQGFAGRFIFPEQHSASNSKTPPGWGVEQEHTYPFRCWVKDLITWSHATDLEATKQAHAVVPGAGAGLVAVRPWYFE